MHDFRETKRQPPGESRPWATILALRNDPLGYLERIAR